MLPYTAALLVPLMAVLASMSGGNAGIMWLVYHVGTKLGAAWAKPIGILPEICFGLCFGYVALMISGNQWVGGISAIWSYRAMELGHGNAYHDGTEQFGWPDRWQQLDYIVRPLCRAIEWGGDRLGLVLDLSTRSKWYCRIFMGTKGLLIGLPLLGPGTIALAILWPLAYTIGFRWMKVGSEPAEWISGYFAGLVLYATLIYSTSNLYTMHRLWALV